mgnify:CR=1 FL=1
MQSSSRTPDHPVEFIEKCLAEGKVLWSYHVNMRFRERPITREMVLQAASRLELVEAYPEDKYFPSYLLLAEARGIRFHVLIAADVSSDNVRVITTYIPESNEWESNLKTRKQRR